MPTKTFFSSSSLAPTCSSHYPFLYTICKTPFPDPLTCMSLNCTPSNYPLSPMLTYMSLNCTVLTYSPILDSSTSTSLNCKFTQTLHDMPSGPDGGLSHLSHWPDNMPSSCSDSLDPFSHLGHLGHLSYLNVLDPELIDTPLHAFIQEEEDP
jgi:hypothetical protein